MAQEVAGSSPLRRTSTHARKVGTRGGGRLRAQPSRYRKQSRTRSATKLRPDFDDTVVVGVSTGLKLNANMFTDDLDVRLSF